MNAITLISVSYTHLSRIDEKHPFVQKAMKLGRVPFGSPTLSDQALMSFPSVKIGPGRSSRSHTAEEYIMLKEIERKFLVTGEFKSLVFAQSRIVQGYISSCLLYTSQQG